MKKATSEPKVVYRTPLWAKIFTIASVAICVGFLGSHRCIDTEHRTVIAKVKNAERVFDADGNDQWWISFENNFGTVERFPIPSNGFVYFPGDEVFFRFTDTYETKYKIRLRKSVKLDSIERTHR